MGGAQSTAEYIAQLEDQLDKMTQQANLATQYLTAVMTKQGWKTFALTTDDMERAFAAHGFRVRTNWQEMTDSDGRICIMETMLWTEEEKAQRAADQAEAEANLKEARDDEKLISELALAGFIVPPEVVAEWTTFQWMMVDVWTQKRTDDDTLAAPDLLTEYEGQV